MTTLACVACAEDKLAEEKPTAPDMGALASAYETPTTTLNASTAPLIAESLLALLDASGALCGWESLEDFSCDPAQPNSCIPCDGIGPIADAVRGLIGAGEDDATPTALVVGDATLAGEGFLRVTRICRGWANAAEPDPANGDSELIVGFTEAGLDPVIFGEMRNCDYLLGGRESTLAGSLAVHIGDGGLELADLDALSLLIDVDLDVAIDGISSRVALDFALAPNGELTVRTELEDGTHALVFVNDAGVGVRGANGEWSCDFVNALECLDAEGAIVSWTAP